jgi:hypothetical protein
MGVQARSVHKRIAVYKQGWAIIILKCQRGHDNVHKRIAVYKQGWAIVLIVSPHTNVGGASRESFGFRFTSPVMPTVNDDDTADDDDGHVPWLALPVDSTVAAPSAATPACAAGSAAPAGAAAVGPK